MPTAYSTNLGLALPVQGELSGTWGDTVNNGITDYVDIAVAGTLTLNGDGAVTLSNTNGNASGTNITSTTAQYAILRITGTLTTTKVITAPSSSKTYTVINDATGGSVTIKASGQTGVTIPVGDKAYVAFNGTDYVRVGASAGGSNTQVQYNSSGNLAGSANFTFDGTTLTANDIIDSSLTANKPVFTNGSKNLVSTGTLGVDQGGTGATSLTANNVILGNGTSAVQFVAPGTSGNVLTSNGTTWQSTTPAAGFSTSADNTFTGTQSFTGTSAKLAVVLSDAAEVATVSATAATGTINYDITAQSVLFYTSNASANWTVNFRASSGTSLNTALATGQSVTVAFLVTQGSTAYFNNSVQVDGTTSGVTMRWLGGAPTAGNASGIDSYRYLIIKTGSATYTVLASVTQFKA
jgi:hypothetical protein